MGKLIIDGNSVYEIDEECICRKEKSRDIEKKKREEVQWKDTGYTEKGNTGH